MLKTTFGLGADHTRIMTILFDYLFHNIDKYAFRELIGDRELAKKVWSIADRSGYVQKNCKLYAYAFHYNRNRGMPTSPAKFEIYKDDVNLLKKIDLSRTENQKAYSLFDFNNLEGAILTSKELDIYIGKFISRKLIFLVRSYGLKRHDIHAQLQHAAMFALRKHYPFYESELHALNICKTAIANAGKGIIEFCTRGKRNALLRENGGFQAVHVPYDSLHTVAVQPEHENEFRVDLQCLVKIADKLKPRPKRFVQAAAGLHDEGFSLYIGCDNADAAYQWDYQRYLKSLQLYYCVSVEQTQKLFSTLRGSLT